MADKVEKRILTLYSDVQATSVHWLWYPFIAVGKITLLQGDPGDGKSTMMMNLIAELSKGGKTPDGKPVGTPQRVIYQCSEDGVSDTIKPRLERCGADCRKVAFINEETYSGLTLDDERIRQAIIEFRPRLVVIDPIQAYLGSDSDLQIAGRARKLMQRLGMWASVYDCAIVLIGHLNKKEGTKGLYRSLGSIDVVAAARSVLQVERDQKDTDIRIVRQIKNSLAPSDGEIRFSITAEIYYCSRMISVQHGPIFTKSEYGKIRMVYSIWICTQPSDGFENTLTRYSIKPEQLIGEAQEETENYDLMSVVMICLGKPGTENHKGILKFMEVLLSSTRSGSEKKKILEEEFGVAMGEELEREVLEVCNLSQGVRAEGREEGRQEGRIEGIGIGEIRMLVQLVREGDLPLERAAAKAKMTVEQFKETMENTPLQAV